MNQFDDWRNKYEVMTIDEQIQYHNALEEKYPNQAHFNYENVKILLDLCKPNPIVLEFGTWKADLCKMVLEQYSVERWIGIEICTAAIEKTNCKSPKLNYILPKQFDWFKHDAKPDCDVIIATHFIEHLSDEHFCCLANYCKGTPYVYFEAPLSDNGQNWNGYLGTHKLNYGWTQVIDVMTKNGFQVVHHLNQGKIFKSTQAQNEK